jgi:arginyl-tRNA synthetase
MHAEIASLLSTAASALGADVSESALFDALTAPKNRDHGDVAFPCFVLAKPLRQAPPAIAAALVDALAGPVAASASIASVEALGPYLNFRLDHAARAAAVLVPAASPTFGQQALGAGKTIGIDYSSPNIAKPFGIGHLRSTAIGHALANLFETLGYRVVGVNHLGDWGTQFGKLMAAFEARGDRDALDADPIQHLYDLYVWFHAEMKERPELAELGRAWFRKLEAGDAQAQAYWTEFRALSLREFERIYARLGVSFDHYWGEAFYEPMLEPLVSDLHAAGLLTTSEGAEVVHVGDDVPPCLIRKSDGATLYATRDLAAARYRYEQLGFDQFLYVVGAPQSVHFDQVFRVLGQMGYAWADRLHHVPFGHIHGISTRQGTLVFLEQILDEGKQRVLEFLAAEKPEYEGAQRDAIAEAVAIGAVVFYDLSRNRIKDYDFSWDLMLKGLQKGEKGNTGIKLQYAYARLCSVEEQYRERYGTLPDAATVDFGQLGEPEAQALVAILEKFETTLQQAATQYEPAVVSRYALELADAFNSFYSHEDKAHYRIVSDDAARSAARVVLVGGVKNALGTALRILGVPHPERI